MESPEVGGIDTSVRFCGHCGTATVFRILAIDMIRNEYIAGDEDETGCSDIIEITTFKLLKCQTCFKVTLEETRNCPEIWGPEEVEVYTRYPVVSKAPPATKDMPYEIASIYQQAREFLPYSPGASAALLRLAIEQLCWHLGKSGKSLNDNIGELVKEGLSITAQQALDYVRVIGNNAVHPGSIVSHNDPKMVETLFKLVNFIVEEMITRPRDIEEIYESLPQKYLDEIEKRKQKLTKSEKTSQPDIQVPCTHGHSVTDLDGI